MKNLTKMSAVIALAGAMSLSACAGEAPAEAQTSEAAEEVAAATEEPTEPVAFDITQISCWDLGTTDDEGQALAATLIFGYAAGAAGEKDQTSDGIEAAITSAFEFCAENPDANALDGFKVAAE